MLHRSFHRTAWLGTIALALLAGCAAFQKAEQVKTTVDEAFTPARLATACATIKAGEDAVLLSASLKMPGWGAEVAAMKAVIPYKQPYCNKKPEPTSIEGPAWSAILNAETAAHNAAVQTGSKLP